MSISTPSSTALGWANFLYDYLGGSYPGGATDFVDGPLESALNDAQNGLNGAVIGGTIYFPPLSGNTPLAENALSWQAHRGAVEFLSWSPAGDDPSAVAFARILLTQAGTATEAMVKEAALVFRGLLERAGIRAIPLLGVGGIALWIPFGDRPPYPPIRAWLHTVAREAETRHTKLISAEWPLSERGNRVHVAVDSNAPGRWSALPYSLRGFDCLPMVTPIRWDELATMWSGDVAAHNSGERLAAAGDVFAGEAAEIGDQRSATGLEPRRSIAIGFAEPFDAFAIAPIAFEPRGRT